MDPVSTALTAAWLDAVRRVQSQQLQELAQIAPQTQPSYDERTLTDVIEGALKSGGAGPVVNDTARAREQQQGQFVDRLV